MRTFSLVRKPTVISVKLILLGNKALAKSTLKMLADVTVEVICYQLKGILMESSNCQPNLRHVSGSRVKSWGI